MKHISQSVQVFETSPAGLSSIKSNSPGKLAQRLKQQRQPWQMSNTQSIAASNLAKS